MGEAIRKIKDNAQGKRGKEDIMRSIRSYACRLFVKYYLAPRFKADKTVEAHRSAMERLSKLTLLPAGTKTMPVSLDGIDAEWVSVGKVPENKAILYLHGGAYTFGSSNTHRDIAARISRYSGFKVLVSNYRLAPEFPYPAAIDDSTEAFRWLVRSGISPDSIAIAGDSAGGGLAIATVLSLREKGDPLPGSVVCFSPWIDLERKRESDIANIDNDPMMKPDWLDHMAALYACDNDLKDPYLSPVYADLKGLPPILIQVGSDEILLGDCMRFRDEALKAGVEVTLDVWEKMWHVWHFFGGMMPEGARALKEAGEFIRGTDAVGAPDPSLWEQTAY